MCEQVEQTVGESWCNLATDIPTDHVTIDHVVQMHLVDSSIGSQLHLNERVQRNYAIPFLVPIAVVEFRVCELIGLSALLRGEEQLNRRLPIRMLKIRESVATTHGKVLEAQRRQASDG